MRRFRDSWLLKPPRSPQHQQQQEQQNQEGQHYRPSTSPRSTPTCSPTRPAHPSDASSYAVSADPAGGSCDHNPARNR
jgi:hypothetical protein